jgi:hypothetical protein
MDHVSADEVCFLAAKARAFSAKEAPPGDTAPASDSADEEQRSVLLDHAGDRTEEELRDAVGALNDDQLVEVMAIALIGRGDFGADDWRAAIAAADDRFDIDAVERLVEMPLLADHLEAGLSALGFSCRDVYEGHFVSGRI